MNDLERDIKVKIRYYLKKIPYSKWISYTPTSFGEIGTPDIIGCIKGNMILIEVKRPGRKPTLIQSVRMEQWARAGAFTFYATSRKDVENTLKEHGYV